MNKFVIKQKLPSLNEYIGACRANAYLGAKFKSEVEEVIGWSIRQALTSKALHKVETPVIIKITWFEKTKRRDVDNIQSSQKFILDALVKNKILKDDSRKFVKQVHHEVVDAKENYVVVELIEYENS